MIERELIALPDGAVVDAVVGYRCWDVIARNGSITLTSVYALLRWTIGVIQASCDCESSGGAHRCGFYAWRTVEAMLRQQRADRSWRATRVLGSVYLWGDWVHVHAHGYRAEYARIASVHADGGIVSELVARQYEVPLVAYDGRSQ